jgi:hypothetical protein
MMASADLHHYTNRVICKAININLQRNFNTESGYQMSSAWKTILQKHNREDATAIPKP